jgi:hypothetical protein
MTTDAVEWAQLEVIDILLRPRHLWERQNKWIRHEIPCTNRSITDLTALRLTAPLLGGKDI